MRCAASRGGPRPRSTAARPATVRGLAAIVLCLVACGAMAASFYRWVDQGGNVHYGDHPPKNALELTRIEVDPAPEAQAPPAPRAAIPNKELRREPAAPDLAARRRATREALDARLQNARQKLDLARAALAKAAAPEDDERDIVQQRHEVGTSGRPDSPGSENSGDALGTGGMLGMAPRSNCRQSTGKDGKQVVICPTMVPNDKYRERIARLEEAVRKAEEEVADAERAYRRGVD
jgi:Domain of unknown function (DUF4124)